MGQLLGNILCKLVAITSEQLEGRATGIGQQTGAMVIVDIVNNQGEENRFVVSRTLDLNLEFGDKIKCIAGRAVVIVNQGINAGSHIISESSANPHTTNHKNLLEITGGLFENQRLGKIPARAVGDIGIAIRSAAASAKKLTVNANR